MAVDGENRLFTANFVLTCSVSLIIFSSAYLLVPALPLYITQRLSGQETDVGLMMGIFSISSVLFYPFFGRQLDIRGRMLFLVLGLSTFALAVFLYTQVSSLPSLFVLRVLHGVTWAAIATALSTLISDVAPASRRGEAIGYFGISTNVAMALGPAASIALIQTYGFPTLFLISGALAALALGVSSRISETLISGKEGSIGLTSISQLPRSRVDLLPAAVMLFVTIGYGAVMYFLPVYALGKGIDNPGIFFTLFAITLILTRSLAGRLSDKLGRRALVIPGIVLVAASMAILGLYATLPALLVAAVLYGVGFGSLHPALMALAVDHVAADSHGAAMGYFAAAFDLGMALGAIIMGAIAQFAGFPSMFFATGFTALLGLVVFTFGSRVSKPILDSSNTGTPTVK